MFPNCPISVGRWCHSALYNSLNKTVHGLLKKATFTEHNCSLGGEVPKATFTGYDCSIGCEVPCKSVWTFWEMLRQYAIFRRLEFLGRKLAYVKTGFSHCTGHLWSSTLMLLGSEAVTTKVHCNAVHCSAVLCSVVLSSTVKISEVHRTTPTSNCQTHFCCL